MGSHSILKPYDVPYLPLKFVPLILNHPAYMYSPLKFLIIKATSYTIENYTSINVMRTYCYVSMINFLKHP